MALTPPPLCPLELRVHRSLSCPLSLEILYLSKSNLKSSKLSRLITVRIAHGRVFCSRVDVLATSRRKFCVSASWGDGCREPGKGGISLAEYVEIAADGTKFLQVMASSLHNVDHGSIMGLTCVPITRVSSAASSLEFPLFLNGLSAMPIKIAVEKGGLPNALEELGNLKDLDLEKIYVYSLDNETTGGEFLVLDERKGERLKVASTFPQAIAVALRYQLPFFLNRDALSAANADFVNRMLINPKAREQDGDVEWLGELSNRMNSITVHQSELQKTLARAVETEQYEEAARRKHELMLYDKQIDTELLHILQRLKALYLERMSIFFKL